MNLSLGEFQALVAKAFRGGGYSWGLTEDASFVARRIAESGLPAGEMAVRLLDRVDGGPLTDRMPDERWDTSGSGLCPVCVGASIADQSGCDRLEIGPTFEPVFLAPFLASTVRTQRGYGYLIEWPSGRCEVSATGISVQDPSPPGAVPLTVSRQRMTIERSSRLDRVELSEVTYERLSVFAHRTYAPATEASRIAGAGAETDDG